MKQTFKPQPRQNYGTDPTYVQELFIQQMQNLTMKSMDTFDYQFSDAWSRSRKEAGVEL